MANSARSAAASAAWQAAIATCGTTASSPAASSEDLAATVAYLEALRDHLDRRKGAWDRPPKKAPPAAPTIAPTRGSGSNHHQQQQRGDFEGPNAFAAFADDDSDDASSSAASSDAGDEVVFGNNAQSRQKKPMEMRRLTIRVLTTLSEVQSAVASKMASDRPVPRWSDAAETYALSYGCATVALSVADERSARILQTQTAHEWLGEAGAGDSVEMDELSDDASVVHVALTHFADCRDRYLSLAERRAAQLRRKLEPQWVDRDEVKARWGQEKWESNPRPKNNYARMRRDHERELRELERAQVVILELDVEAAVERSGTMMRGEIPGGGDGGSGGGRYNSLRPDYASAGGRVPFELYPDPTLFGWAFTGSCSEPSRVEFYERAADDGSGGVVKLDFFYSTGTVKTSLHHPGRGKPTQLFGRAGNANGPQPAITPEQYVEVLRNPRAHTGGRYHTSDGGGGGRGRGRGRGRSNQHR